MAQSGAALEAPSLPSSAVLASADMDIFNFGVFCGAVEMSPSLCGYGSLWLSGAALEAPPLPSSAVLASADQR